MKQLLEVLKSGMEERKGKNAPQNSSFQTAMSSLVQIFGAGLAGVLGAIMAISSQRAVRDKTSGGFNDQGGSGGFGSLVQPQNMDGKATKGIRLQLDVDSIKVEAEREPSTYCSVQIAPPPTFCSGPYLPRGENDTESLYADSSQERLNHPSPSGKWIGNLRENPLREKSDHDFSDAMDWVTSYNSISDSTEVAECIQPPRRALGPTTKPTMMKPGRAMLSLHPVPPALARWLAEYDRMSCFFVEAEEHLKQVRGRKVSDADSLSLQLTTAPKLFPGATSGMIVNIHIWRMSNLMSNFEKSLSIG
jgi:hypothetical protein